MNKNNGLKIARITVICLSVFTLLFVLGGIFLDGGSNDIDEEIDTALVTKGYQTDITIDENNSYVVKETIDAAFEEERHGIYRNIPYKGYANIKSAEGDYTKRPMYAEVEMLYSNVTYAMDSEYGYKVYQFGDEDKLITSNKYEFTYRYTPKTDMPFHTATFNVFPPAWKSTIPTGSSFTVTFPKEFDHSLLKLYYGKSGQSKEAEDILSLSWNGNTLRGVLKQPLPAYQTVTFVADMPQGYFATTNTLTDNEPIIISIMLLLSGIILVSFIVFGIDRKLKPKINYQAPEGIDSALAGYLVDGTIDNDDLVSGIYYLASKGYLAIQNKEDDITIIKKKELKDEIPRYLKTLFDGIFGKHPVGQEVTLSSLTYNFSLKLQASKKQLEQYVNTQEVGGIYTKSSKIMRGVGLAFSIISMCLFVIMSGIFSKLGGELVVTSICSIILYTVGLMSLCYLLDKWYAFGKTERTTIRRIGIFSICFALCSYGALYAVSIYKHRIMDYKVALIVMLVTAAGNAVLTIYLKKRTRKCQEYLNELLGFREYIEQKGILRQMEVINQNPDLYYDIIPYAMVFGLMDQWVSCLKDIPLKKPEWHIEEGVQRQTDSYMDYAMFDTFLHHSTKDMSRTLSSVRPVETNTAGVSSSGGGYSGGGFSGGGFGGGGGGSW